MFHWSTTNYARKSLLTARRSKITDKEKSNKKYSKFLFSGHSKFQQRIQQTFELWMYFVLYVCRCFNSWYWKRKKRLAFVNLTDYLIIKRKSKFEILLRSSVTQSVAQHFPIKKATEILQSWNFLHCQIFIQFSDEFSTFYLLISRDLQDKVRGEIFRCNFLEKCDWKKINKKPGKKCSTLTTKIIINQVNLNNINDLKPRFFQMNSFNDSLCISASVIFNGWWPNRFIPLIKVHKNWTSKKSFNLKLSNLEKV